MTPDLLHYVFVAAGWIAIPAFLLAALVIHRRVPSRWTALLIAGIATSLLGQAAQQLAPIHDMAYEEFRGVVVSTGSLSLAWHAGSLLSAAGWIVSASGALGFALRGLPRPTA
ncbi:MAG: hypothetical protein GY946_05570 [bacterium]|nr:hypothetical protein [bacterium]